MNQILKSHNGKLDFQFVPIPLNVLEALCKWHITRNEMKIIHVVLRKTLGWHGKHEDWIALSQFEKATGIRKPHVSKNVNTLVRRRILLCNGKRIGINHTIEEWDKLQEDVTSQKLQPEGTPVTSFGTNELPPSGTTTETSTTNTVATDNSSTKNYGDADISKIISLVQTKFQLPKLDGSLRENRYAAHNLISSFTKICGDRVQAMETICQIIKRARKHDFWGRSGNITSIVILEKKAVSIAKQCGIKFPAKTIDVQSSNLPKADDTYYEEQRLSFVRMAEKRQQNPELPKSKPRRLNFL